MHQNCYIIAHEMLTSLGNSAETLRAIANEQSGIRKISDNSLSEKPFHAALFSESLRTELKSKSAEYSLLENGLITCIECVFEQAPQFKSGKRGILVLTSTKGNIEMPEGNQRGSILPGRTNMAEMAKAINDYFGFEHNAILVSNACISGVSALLVAKKLMAAKSFDFAIVAGGDLVTKFVVSGFQSLMAISSTPCMPYDKARTGMTPGEGCAAVLLSNELPSNTAFGISIIGGGQSNDANHISGPSRTGEGLVSAVSKAFSEANCTAEDLDMINAHGTATAFNDEMEAIAFQRLGLSDTPTNSLKGFVGHTFAAAGLIETIATAESLKTGLAYKTLGLVEAGISVPLNLTFRHTEIKAPRYALKTISGFGGTNGALILEKVEA